MGRSVPVTFPLVVDGAQVQRLTPAPDGRFYVRRAGAATLLLDRWELHDADGPDMEALLASFPPRP